MQPIPLPGPIAALVRGLRWERDTVGRSFAGVYRLSDGKNTYYLKCGDEADGLAGECRNLRWLRGRLPVPEVLAWAAEGGMEYMLLSEAGGRMLCDASYLRRPELAVSALASGLRMLRAVDISGCPLKNGLDEKLEAAAGSTRTIGRRCRTATIRPGICSASCGVPGPRKNPCSPTATIACRMYLQKARK